MHNFKLYRVLLTSLNMRNIGEFSWRSILTDCNQVQKRKRKFTPLVHVIHITSHQEVSCRSRAVSAMHEQSCRFAHKAKAKT